MKFIKRLGIAMLLLYAVMCLVLYLIQDRFIFDPHPLPQDFIFRAGEEVEIAIDHNLSLNCLFIREPNAKGVILYLHGTRGNNRRCIRQAQMMMANGYDIFMPDYRGYGKSEGKIISAQQLYSDIQKVYDHLKTIYNESQIVVLGYSLGTGLASYLAANNNPQQLILISAYLSIADLKNRKFPIVPDFLLKFPFKNDDFLESVNCQVSLFHGTQDEIIPYDSSEKLKMLKPELINIFPLRGAGHRGSIFHEDFRRGVSQLVSKY